MARFDLARHRGLLVREALPRYGTLGTLAFAYLHGSLVRGYTDDADLDVIAVWADPAVPTTRAAIVAGLDERRPPAPSVVDYRDVHLDRFVLAGQEYNVGHHALPDFRALVAAALAGRPPPGARVPTPHALAAGFRAAELLADPTGAGAELQRAVATFPPHLKEQARRIVRSRREGVLTELRTFAAREDWFAFHCALVAVTRAALQVLFAVNGEYYPGDKWLRQALARLGVAPRPRASPPWRRCCASPTR